MATYTNNSRMLKKYYSTPGRYASFGPVNSKPKRLRVYSHFARTYNYKLLSFMLMVNR